MQAPTEKTYIIHPRNNMAVEKGEEVKKEVVRKFNVAEASVEGIPFNTNSRVIAATPGGAEAAAGRNAQGVDCHPHASHPVSSLRSGPLFSETTGQTFPAHASAVAPQNQNSAAHARAMSVPSVALRNIMILRKTNSDIGTVSLREVTRAVPARGARRGSPKPPARRGSVNSNSSDSSVSQGNLPTAK